MAWRTPAARSTDKRIRAFAAVRIKDLIEEGLFALHRDLFSDLSLVFFDTTALYFEGNGGQSIGQYGHSKGHQPDLRQMVVGVIRDNKGNPICSELWPGNIADVTSLVPIIQRLEKRFGIERVCIVADRGMISETTIAEIEVPKGVACGCLETHVQQQTPFANCAHVRIHYQPERR